MPPLPRREALKLISTGMMAAAGCLERSASNPTATSSPTDHSATPATESPTPTPSQSNTLELGDTLETTHGIEITVRDVRVEKFIRSTSVGSPTHIDVACLDQHQFAVVAVQATDESGASRLKDVRFALEIDGVQHPTSDQHWYWAHPPGSYERPGIPAYPAPVSDANEAWIVYLGQKDPYYRWRIPSETVDHFGTVPNFTVQSLTVPDSVGPNEAVQASIVVSNTGKRDGRFMAEFGAGGLSDHDEVTLDVPAGGERSLSEFLTHYSEAESEIDVTLDWGCESLTRAVTVTE